jgi:hypothetical protein
VRWGLLGRRVTSRIKSITERQAKPSHSRWVLIRDRDGRVWAGPYRWRGQTFTEAERFWYQFTNHESAQAAVTGHGFVGVTVKQIV